ncbi:hypothetical protein Pmani_013681 [Petrolisthes manimaculis]|uniref:Uncharacterized protein n=1 Tax=Petrolisthes manimaculis TaxID=1843537 RepID=A0AAE1UBX7_9EUCA|nr:hypothetical protein Pmani_013681 [Petrolisthes manimaculis]
MYRLLVAGHQGKAKYITTTIPPNNIIYAMQGQSEKEGSKGVKFSSARFKNAKVSTVKMSARLSTVRMRVPRSAL